MSLSPVMSKTSSEANGTLDSPLRKRTAPRLSIFREFAKTWRARVLLEFYAFNDLRVATALLIEDEKSA